MSIVVLSVLGLLCLMGKRSGKAGETGDSYERSGFDWAWWVGLSGSFVALWIVGVL